MLRRDFSKVFENFERACIDLAPEYILASNAPDTYEGVCEAFKQSGKPVIWDGASERTIFSSAKGNYAFRAWHDMTHIQHGLGFTTGEECEAFRLQKIALERWADANYDGFVKFPRHMLWDTFTEGLNGVLRAEIIGQLAYKVTWGEFPANQRAFVEHFLHNEGEAIDNRAYLL